MLPRCKENKEKETSEEFTLHRKLLRKILCRNSKKKKQSAKIKTLGLASPSLPKSVHRRDQIRPSPPSEISCKKKTLRTKRTFSKFKTISVSETIPLTTPHVTAPLIVTAPSQHRLGGLNPPRTPSMSAYKAPTGSPEPATPHSYQIKMPAGASPLTSLFLPGDDPTVIFTTQSLLATTSVPIFNAVSPSLEDPLTTKLSMDTVSNQADMDTYASFIPLPGSAQFPHLPDRGSLLPTCSIPALPGVSQQHPAHSSIMQVDGEISCSDSEDDVSSGIPTFQCELCSKMFTTKFNLQRHIQYRCKLGRVEPELDKRKSFQTKIYHSDKDLGQYINTCGNNYAKFMCCENEHYPITIGNFWPCLFDYRDKIDFETVAHEVSSHNCYEVLTSILTDAHNFYNIHEITFTRHALVESGGKLFDISQYRVPKFWQNAVKRNRPTFKVEVKEGMVAISFSAQYLPLLDKPLYLTKVTVCHSPLLLLIFFAIILSSDPIPKDYRNIKICSKNTFQRFPQTTFHL